MPMAIPLVAAYASVSAGIAAGGLIGGLMIAGGAMTAMGALAGDKTLSRWGGMLSLAGGVAGLASGAWSSAANEAAADAAYSAAADEALASSGNVYASAGAETAANATSAAQLADVATEAAGPGMLQPAAPMDPMAAAGPPGMDFGPPQWTASTPAPVTPASVPSVANAPVATPPASVQAPGATPAATPTTPPVDAGNPLTDAFKWASKNDTNARITQTGAGLLQAGMNYYGQQDAVKEQIRLQEAAMQRARERMNQSTVGLRMPVYKRGG